MWVSSQNTAVTWTKYPVTRLVGALPRAWRRFGKGSKSRVAYRGFHSREYVLVRGSCTWSKREEPLSTIEMRPSGSHLKYGTD